MSNSRGQDRTLAGPLLTVWMQEHMQLECLMVVLCRVNFQCYHKKDGISIKISDMVVSKFALALPRLFLLLFAQNSQSMNVGGKTCLFFTSDRDKTDTVINCWQGEMFV